MNKHKHELVAIRVKSNLCDRIGKFIIEGKNREDGIGYVVT
jgi:hypothetical protein